MHYVVYNKYKSVKKWFIFCIFCIFFVFHFFCFCPCLRANVEGTKGVVASHPSNGDHIHEVKQGREFGEDKSPQRDNNPPQLWGFVKWLERMFTPEHVPKQYSNHGEKGVREVNDECHWSVCV